MKNRILQEATKEILHRGLKFSVRDLASRLGISTKTLYQHFPSKERIIASIVEQAVNQMKDREKELMNDSSLPLKQKLYEALVIIPQGFVFSDIRVMKELQMAYPDQWAIMNDYLTKGWDNIRLLILEGTEKGDIRDFDVETFIRVYIGAMYQLMDHSVASPSGLRMEDSLSLVVDLLLRGIYADPSVKEGSR
ncbi:TetR/AcrR family transcriptional regulator [Cohnella herbarum]|uniref:TetR/AcrR family transcriptional regulator n=1 Tax=Cohnella herbarum TaxID=2728023 RepID=A0A7Z2ZQF9_9BACL|nr:TetR/AcrR family transcriptional regulator [Cohnella herbarum]QJD86977.1 TetR/AcrR family transcriptional regulator [Cohnella herbarum]